MIACDTRTLRQRVFSRDGLSLLVEGIGAAVLAADLVLLLRSFLVNRSIGGDEAMLAYTLFYRSSFWVTPADLNTWVQSAPLPFILFVKLLVLIFGRTRWVLRFPAAFAYVGMLILFYLLLRRTLHFPFPIAGTACLANVAFLMRYANVFKPYAIDTMLVLLVLVLYQRYREEKISAVWLALIFAALVWCSNPVCFFTGAAALWEVLCGLFGKNKKRAGRGMLLGLAACLSILTEYLLWLKPILDAGDMSAAWVGDNFVLFPTSMEALMTMLQMVWKICYSVGSLWQLVLLLAAAAFVWNFFSARITVFPVLFCGCAITLVASHFGFFPVSERLFLFLLPLLMLLALNAGQRIAEVLSRRALLLGPCALVLLMGVLVLSGGGIRTYSDTKNVYWSYEETTMNMTYLQEHLLPDEKVYVLYRAVPGFCFENGYGNTSFAGGQDNIILGNMFRTQEEQAHDIDAVLQAHQAYVMTNTPISGRVNALYMALVQKGSLELVNAPYGTVMYYYSDSPARQKGQFTLAAKEVQTDPQADICSASVSVSATGEAYLMNGCEHVYVCARREGETAFCAAILLSDNLAPGKSRDYSLSFAWQNADRVYISLVKPGYQSAEIMITR